MFTDYQDFLNPGSLDAQQDTTNKAILHKNILILYF